MRLTAGLCPDQLGELQRSGDCTAIGESVLLLRDSEVERQGKGGEGIKEKRSGGDDAEFYHLLLSNLTTARHLFFTILKLLHK